MKLSSNFIYFHNELGLKQSIDILSKAGFEGIDFNADLPEYHTDVHDPAFYKEIKLYADDRGIKFYQTHAPYASSFPEEDKTEKRFYDIVKSIENSALLGAEMVVVHPCMHLNCKSEERWQLMMELNHSFYKSLIPYAEEYGIKISIENIGGAVTAKAEGLIELLTRLDNPVFNACFDVGHAFVSGSNPAEEICKLGKHIGCTHIHDNDGVNDTHTLPFYGNIDWESVMEAFAKIDYTGNLNYEAGAFVKKVPISLRQESADYMARIGKHLIERYEFHKSKQ